MWCLLPAQPAPVHRRDLTWPSRVNISLCKTASTSSVIGIPFGFAQNFLPTHILEKKINLKAEISNDYLQMVHIKQTLNFAWPCWLSPMITWPSRSWLVQLFHNLNLLIPKAGLSKFAKLARSVTRSRSVLVTQFSSHLPAMKDVSKQSNIAHVSICLCICSQSLYKLCAHTHTHTRCVLMEAWTTWFIFHRQSTN